jgi:hypothetical protein
VEEPKSLPLPSSSRPCAPPRPPSCATSFCLLGYTTPRSEVCRGCGGLLSPHVARPHVALKSTGEELPTARAVSIELPTANILDLPPSHLAPSAATSCGRRHLTATRARSSEAPHPQLAAANVPSQEREREGGRRVPDPVHVEGAKVASAGREATSGVGRLGSEGDSRSRNRGRGRDCSSVLLHPQAPPSCRPSPPPPIVVVELLRRQSEPHTTIAGEEEGGSATHVVQCSPAVGRTCAPPEQGKGRERG